MGMRKAEEAPSIFGGAERSLVVLGIGLTSGVRDVKDIVSYTLSSVSTLSLE